ncbi:MAG: ATP-binding protein [Thermosynechococcaceae cyanobacterium MS004]|nr:ATP-binding protein [Thermosynechococcaceae cyanobacterium MS004]
MSERIPVTAIPVKAKEREAIIQPLRAGVVPRKGLHLIQVGRAGELAALIQDVQRIHEGGAAIRFVIGEYGSGKTFFLSLVRSIALQEKLVTAHADLTPDRRLHATGGQARSLYTELMRNLSTRAKPDGGALASVVERFVTSAITEGRDRSLSPEAIIRERLAHLSEMVGGYDFAEVIAAYWRGHDTSDEALKTSAVRWLRGEFSSKLEARQALGVRTIVDDTNVYDQLKLLAQLVRLAGYGGLLICFDELVNLYKLSNTQARKSNYEQILRILNDILQGTAVGLGILLGGTPEFLTDTRRGLYSYPALQSRLTLNTFAVNGLVDYSGPVLRLTNLSPEDLYVLLCNIRHVYSSGEPARYLMQDAGIQQFMAHCSQRIGDAYFRTPRNTITAFVNLLAVLDQNPQVQLSDLITQIQIQREPITVTSTSTLNDEQSETRSGQSISPETASEDELATFRL